jgi:hypothetical protein
MKYLLKLFNKIFAPLDGLIVISTLKEDLIPVRKNNKK